MLNWGSIQNGATFQALVNTLLWFEDRTIGVYGRPGRDAGIDARTADGVVIWQYKFHAAPSISKTISDALGELEKIKKYRRNSDSRSGLWSETKIWRLVTNLKINPSDQQKWENEVGLAFQQQKLNAELWSEEVLEALLIRHPAVERAFFDGENRGFLSLPEAQAMYDNEATVALSAHVPIVGRDESLNRLMTFLQGSKNIICVHGPGGVGKTRLILEFGNRAPETYQVFWGNVEALSQTSNWLSAIIPDRPTLLLLDEPADGRILRHLAEQMRNPMGRMAAWKVVVTTRSPKDPIVDSYRNLPVSFREDLLELQPLQSSEASEVILNLMNLGSLAQLPDEQKTSAATHIYRITSGLPVWMTLAVQVLESSRGFSDLPRTTQDIARKYVDEVIVHQPGRAATQQQIEALIQWLALYRQVNVEDKALVGFLSRKSGFSGESELLKAIRSLVQRRFVVSRGINRRIHEIKPDVVNDYILSSWLTDNDGGSYQPSSEAGDVVTCVIKGIDGKAIPDVHEVVRTLSVVELKERFQGRSVELLSPLIQALLQAGREGPLIEQQAVVGILKFLSFARVADSVNIIRTIRLHSHENQEIETGLFGKRILTHHEIVASLPWQLFCAGQYANSMEERKVVLDEMVTLFFLEDNDKSKDGERVKDLLPRLVEGGTNFRSSYVDDVYDRGKQLLLGIWDHGIQGEQDLRLAKLLLSPYITVERSQTRFDEQKFAVASWFVPPTSPDGIRRNDLRNVLRNLTSNPDDRITAFAWNLLQEAHASANRARQRVGDLFEADLNDDLRWVKARISELGVTTETLQQSRGIWDWHVRFEATEHLKALAQECENIYSNDEGAREFDVFFDFGKYEEAKAKAIELGRTLSAATADDLEAVINRALTFNKNGGDWGAFLDIGRYIEEGWSTNVEIAKFVQRILGRPHSEPFFALAVNILDKHFKDLRENGNTTLREDLDRAFDWAASENKVRFLIALYVRPHPLRTGLLTNIDSDFFECHFRLFEDQEELPLAYRILGCLFHTDWSKVRRSLDELWAKTGDSKKSICYFNLLDGIHFITLFKDSHPVSVGKDVYDFLLDHLLDIPDVDDLQHQASYELEQFRDSVGRMPVSWLSEALRRRADLFNPDSPGGSTRQGTVIPSHFRLSTFVREITPSEVSDPSIRHDIDDLLSFNFTRNRLGYYLPEYLSDVDPQGYIVPDLVAEKITTAHGDAEAIFSWSRYASSYPSNSQPWRKIAIAAVGVALSLDERSKYSILLSLEDSATSSSYPSGQMDPQPGQFLQEARKLAEAETDPILQEYRKWKVRQAQAHYEFEVERYREEKGE